MIYKCFFLLLSFQFVKKDKRRRRRNFNTLNKKCYLFKIREMNLKKNIESYQFINYKLFRITYQKRVYNF